MLSAPWNNDGFMTPEQMHRRPRTAPTMHTCIIAESAIVFVGFWKITPLDRGRRRTIDDHWRGRTMAPQSHIIESLQSLYFIFFAQRKYRFSLWYIRNVLTNWFVLNYSYFSCTPNPFFTSGYVPETTV